MSGDPAKKSSGKRNLTSNKEQGRCLTLTHRGICESKHCCELSGELHPSAGSSFEPDSGRNLRTIAAALPACRGYRNLLCAASGNDDWCRFVFRLIYLLPVASGEYDPSPLALAQKTSRTLPSAAMTGESSVALYEHSPLHRLLALSQKLPVHCHRQR